MVSKGANRWGARAARSFAGCRLWLVLAVSAALAGCAELPALAPTIGEVEQQGNSLSTDPFIVIDTDKRVLDTLSAMRPPSFSGHFESRAPRPELRVSVGDALQINVLEQVSAGLFSSPAPATTTPAAPGSSGVSNAPLTLQPIQVEADGTINVPFAGRIVAAGRTTSSIRAEIEHKLESKAIFPQVQVLLVNPQGAPTANSAAVGGEVNKAGLYSLTPSGNRLLDLIAQAGGARFPAYETTVSITRHGKKRETLLQNVIDNPQENVFVYPHDDIYLTHDPRTFTVLGASSKVGRYGFETARLNLAEAVAIGGGFVDASADPAGVYVFRVEPGRVVKMLRPLAEVDESAPTPVLYRVNLRDGDGYFLSRRFEMRDKDIVLLAASDGAQFQKLLNLIQSGTNIAIGGKTLLQQNSVVLSTLSTSTTSTATK